ncbi:hypothetical protein AK51_23215 [Serratia nematodiphila DZ0503SBS1]|nr:hypothetical protein AK51_23215 [Serratia nematodiphila DZ0503SBS1]
MRAGEGRERHHAARAVAHIPFVDVIRQHAERRRGLHVDFFHSAAVDEVVDVGRAPGGGEGIVDVVDRYAQRLSLALIDIDLQLRAVVQAVVAHA